VGLERGSLSLVSIIEEILRRESSGSGLEIREYGRRDPSWTTWHPLSANVGTNLSDKRCSSVRVGRSRTKATEFSSFPLLCRKIKTRDYKMNICKLSTNFT
jgi:hypothetical protein